MTPDWQAFSLWTALAGGLLIGLAATLFVLLRDHPRIAERLINT